MKYLDLRLLLQPYVLLVFFAWPSLPVLLGCSPPDSFPPSTPASPAGEAALDAPAPSPTLVRDDGANLLLRYRAPTGDWTGVATVAEVPEEARAEVQVIDLSRSPAARQAELWVELADLRTRQADGSYPVRLVPRRTWEQQLTAPTAAAPPGEAPAHPGGGPPPLPAGHGGAGPHLGASPTATVAPAGRLVMYSTQGCPVCTQARRFLQGLHIPFVEKDVQRDPAAAHELQRKAKQAGVSASGVPVFEYRGRLLPGFDKERLLAMLRPS